MLAPLSPRFGEKREFKRLARCVTEKRNGAGEEENGTTKRRLGAATPGFFTRVPKAA